MKNLLAVGALSVGLIASANAFVLFDFEEFSGTTGHSGALTSLSSTQSGVTLTIVRSSGAAFDVFDTSSLTFPLTWEDRALDPFASAATNDFFVGTFSVGVFQFEVEFTDFGGDPDIAQVEAFSGPNGTGTSLGTSSVLWGLESSPNYVGVGLTSATPIQSIVFRGGDIATFPNSMYIDNIAIDPVPEPATLAVLGLGAVALIRRRRK